MSDIDRITLIGLAAIGLAFMFFRLGFPVKSNDEPGPHNNWRVEDRGKKESSFDEGGAGMTGGDF